MWCFVCLFVTSNELDLVQSYQIWIPHMYGESCFRWYMFHIQSIVKDSRTRVYLSHWLSFISLLTNFCMQYACDIWYMKDHTHKWTWRKQIFAVESVKIIYKIKPQTMLKCTVQPHIQITNIFCIFNKCEFVLKIC